MRHGAATPAMLKERHYGSGHDWAKNQERWAPYAERGWTGEVQLEAMDAEGIDVAAIFPSRGLFALAVPDLDPGLAAAIARAYNNWLYDFCQADPRRLIGAGMIFPLRNRGRSFRDAPVCQGARIPRGFPQTKRGQQPQLVRSIL